MSEPQMKTEVVPEPEPFDQAAEERAQREWEELFRNGTTLAPQITCAFKGKQKLILTVREDMRVGNKTHGILVGQHYGDDVKEIEVIFECIGPAPDECSVLVIASEDGHDKPKYRMCVKLSDLRAYPEKKGEKPKAYAPPISLTPVLDTLGKTLNALKKTVEDIPAPPTMPLAIDELDAGK